MIELAVFTISSVVGALIWGIRLEGKTNLHEQRIDDLKELINSRFDGLGQRLDRIERSLNGYMREH